MKNFFAAFFVFCAFCAGTPVFAQNADSSGVPAAADDAFSLFAEPAAKAPSEASFEVFPSAERVPAGGEFFLLAKISTLPGWHVYWKNPGEAGLPLSVDWTRVPAAASFGKWIWSAPQYAELMGLANYVYEGAGYVKIPVRVAADAPAGAAVFAGTASFLACDDNGCLPMNAEFSVGVEIVPAAEAAVPANAEIFAEAEKAFPLVGSPEILSAEYGVAGGRCALSVELKKNIAADDGSGSAFPRFFPESEKFSASAAAVKPEVSASGDGALLRFDLPLKESASDKDEIRADGVLVFGDGSAYEIAPARRAAALGGNASAKSASLLGNLGLVALAFFGGLVLNLMPCVFPVLGLKIMHFVGKAGADGKKIARHGFAFGAGVLVSFWILAGALIALRSGGEQLGWGFQLQEPVFVYGMAVLLLVFGLAMSGVFEVGVGAAGVGGSLQEKSGCIGSFFSGVLAVVVATPCAAPFLAPALGGALTLPPAQSLVLFTCIALGLAAPYVVLSCAPSLLKFLPKPGAWMETFRQAMAFLLYAPALYFVWVLTGQVGDAFVQRDLLLSFAAIALACWIYGRWAVAWRSRASRVAGTLAALAIFAGTCVYAVGLLVAEPDAEEWIPWSREAQEKALADGNIVYVDFTARWCATCQVNKRVYSDEVLREKFAEAGVVPMRADWTNKNPEITEELGGKYNRAAVPVNVFLKKDREPVILGELFSGPETVISGLEKIRSE